jgi:integrase
MRISESLNLKKENFDLSSNPIKITIPAKLTKTQTERIAFISNEAFNNLQKVIDEYFQVKTLNNFEQYFYQLRKRLGYIEKYDHSINYKINIHSLRAFFRTTAIKSNINPDISEVLIGHAGYLTTYKRIEESDLIAAYKKLEPKLRIF